MKKYLLITGLYFLSIHPIQFSAQLTRFADNKRRSNRIAALVQAEEEFEKAQAKKLKLIINQSDPDIGRCCDGDTDACVRMVLRDSCDDSKKDLCFSMYYREALMRYKGRCIADATHTSCIPLLAAMRKRESHTVADAIEKELRD